MNKLALTLLIILILALISPLTLININAQSNNDSPTWTFIDAGDKAVNVTGETIGKSQGQPFAGWYTDTVVYDPDTNITVVAWARWDPNGPDYIYLAFLEPVDADGDGLPESLRKTIKYVDSVSDLKSLDSLTIGKIDTNNDGKKETYVLLTWTYYDSTEYNNVAGALFVINGTKVWGPANIRSTTAWEEYSRSCFVPTYNGGSGGFLIVWYTSYDKSIDGKWLYYDGTQWTLTSKFDITFTGSLEVQCADQIMCIGGQNKALVVYRYKDLSGDLGIYARLIEGTSVSYFIEVYDDYGVEESIGVKGAYMIYDDIGFFAVPFISGSNVGYTIIRESIGLVEQRTTYPGSGKHPYIIGLSDRFVMAWVDGDGNGIKVGNIIPDPDNDGWREWYIYYTEIDSLSDNHPLVRFDEVNDKYIVVWTGHSTDDSNQDNNIRLAILTPNSGTIPPSIDPGYPVTLIDEINNQKAHGLAVISMNEFVVAYTDDGDGEEDLLAYVKLPRAENVGTNGITLYKLPGDVASYKQKIIDLIDGATSSVYVAVAFFEEDSPGSEGTISKALVDAKNRNVDVKVIIDDDSNNDAVYNYLTSNGVSVIKASVSGEPKHIMHDKFIVIDGKEVIVSTANFIPEDFDMNNNTAIYIGSKVIAYFYEQEFLYMWNNGNGRFGTSKTESHDFIAFISYSGRTIVVEGYFGPQSYGDKGIIPNIIYGFITRASSSIYFASYIFTTSGWVTPIYNALVNAYNNGIDVKGVFDEGLNVDVPGRRLYSFIANNVPIAFDNHPYKMHVKLFVIDNKVAILGSWNPTGSATTIHDENILVMRDSDITNGFAKQLADYILDMYNSPIFVKSPYQYNPTHLVIAGIEFRGDPSNEWVVIYNPTGQTIDLSNYVIGDIDNLFEDSDDGLYRFPEGAKVEPYSCIVVAYDKEAFENKYGFEPDFEIESMDKVTDIDNDGEEEFTGSWDLNDDGDEVILAINQDGFLLVVDAVWYGVSNYITVGAQPVSISVNDYILINSRTMSAEYYWDAINPIDKYSSESESEFEGSVDDNIPVVKLNCIGVNEINVLAEGKPELEAYIEEIIITGGAQTYTITGRSKIINTDIKQLNPDMIYTIEVVVKAWWKWKVKYIDSLYVLSCDGEKISILTSNETITGAKYEVVNSRTRAIVINVETDKNIRSYYVNVTTPSKWEKIIGVEYNGQSYDNWGYIDKRTIWIDPSDGDPQFRILGSVPVSAAAAGLGGSESLEFWILRVMFSVIMTILFILVVTMAIRR